MRRLVSLALILLSAASLAGAPAAHDFHVSYARLALEGRAGLLQIRLFKDDLELALRGRFNRPALTMKVDPAIDSLFATYLNETLILTFGDQAVPGVIVSSGEEVQNGIPVWWYTLSYETAAGFDRLHIRHDVLLDVFDDQKNVFRVKHFPSENEWSLYFVNGDSDYALSLAG